MTNKLDAQGKPICPACDRFISNPDSSPFVGEQRVHPECWSSPFPHPRRLEHRGTKLSAGAMKLLRMDDRTKIARVECPCGGQTIIPTVDASEQAPRLGWCPRCDRELRYPNDLQT